MTPQVLLLNNQMIYHLGKLKPPPPLPLPHPPPPPTPPPAPGCVGFGELLAFSDLVQAAPVAGAAGGLSYSERRRGAPPSCFQPLNSSKLSGTSPIWTTLRVTRAAPAAGSIWLFLLTLFQRW